MPRSPGSGGPAATRGRRRAYAAAIAASVAVFAVVEAAAMAAYPGGTWWDPARRGASFWENYLCDFVRAVAVDGRPNPVGSRLASAAMIVLTLGLVPVWLGVPPLWAEAEGGPRAGGVGVAGGAWDVGGSSGDVGASSRPAGRVMGAERGALPASRLVPLLGVLSVIATLIVILLPSDRFSRLHGFAVVLAGVPGLTALVLAVVRLLSGERRPRFAGGLGAALLASAGIDFVAYVAHLLAGGLGTPFLPTAQHVALIALVAWMVGVAWRLARGG